MELDFKCSDVGVWKKALSSYESKVESLNKPDLVSLDQYYRVELPSLLHGRDPNPYLTTSELSQLMKWKLSRGKWRYSLNLSLNTPRFDFFSFVYFFSLLLLQGRVCSTSCRLWTIPW